MSQYVTSFESTFFIRYSFFRDFVFVSYDASSLMQTKQLTEYFEPLQKLMARV